MSNMAHEKCRHMIFKIGFIIGISSRVFNLPRCSMRSTHAVVSSVRVGVLGSAVSLHLGFCGPSPAPLDFANEIFKRYSVQQQIFPTVNW
jgi:hypothetical protein